MIFFKLEGFIFITSVAEVTLVIRGELLSM